MAAEIDRLEAEFHRVAALSGNDRARAVREVEARGEPGLAAALRELLAAADLTGTPLDGGALSLAAGIALVDDLRSFVLGGPSAAGGSPADLETIEVRLCSRNFLRRTRAMAAVMKPAASSPRPE